MTRTNLVDAYDNRSVVAKLVNMEERISDVETSIGAKAEAAAEAAASSASAAAASQSAAKTAADTAAAALANTVDLSSKQTITGAKTFAGDTTVTGSFATSGNAEMAKLDIDTGKLTVGSGGSAEINGPLIASNPANVLQAANHDSVLTSNDVLTAKDINEVNGSANNLVHRSGSETIKGSKIFTEFIRQLNGDIDGTATPTTYESINNLYCLDKNNYSLLQIRRDRDANFDRAYLSCNKNNGDFVSLDIRLESNGTASLILRQKINGVSKATTIYNG